MATTPSGEQEDEKSRQTTSDRRAAHLPGDQQHSGLSRRKDGEPLWRTIQRYIWDDPDKPADEKKFLFKLDVFLLSYACLAYFCKGIDQANLANAYVSGLQEALDMRGNELAYAANVFTAGYVLSQLPAVVLVTRVRPSYLISALEVL